MIIEQVLLFNLVQRLEKIEEQIIDDACSIEHWNGIKEGLIIAIGIVLQQKLNYNATSQDIRKIIIERGIQ